MKRILDLIITKIKIYLYKFNLKKIECKGIQIFEKGFNIDIGKNANTSIIKMGDIRARKNFNILIEKNAILSIEDNVFFNNNCSINVLGSICIGKDCLFGENVKMYDHNHNYRDNTNLIKNQGYSIDSIEIGSNCWIASNVTILKGVKIGNNVVIGANCLIYKDVPSNSIVKKREELVVSSYF